MKHQKTTLFTILIILGSLQAFSQTNVGGLLGYASEIETAGIGITGEKFINGKFSIAPSFVYFFSKTQSIIKQNMWELNGDVNYQYYTTGTVRVFFIGGLNLTGIKESSTDPSFPFSTTDTKIGINVGTGISFDVSQKLQPFFMLKYVISDFDHFMIGGGVKFKLKT